MSLNVNSVEKSKAYNKRLKNTLAGGLHYNFRTIGAEIPLHFSTGTGSRLWDLDGNEYLDFYAKFGAMILGHSNEGYNLALKDQIDKILTVNHCDLDLEVSEMLVDALPGVELVRFCLSGSEVVQNALRLARGYTGKNRFIRFDGHYHGNMDNIIGGKIKEAGWPVPVDFKGDPRGTLGRANNIMEDQSFMLPWNDLDTLNDVINRYGDEIAAIIMEPICINGGGIMPDQGYLEEVRSLCDKNNIVLIFDEIITGFRVGYSGAQGLFNVTPDLTVLGKAVAGGMPVSVLGGKREIMKLIGNKKVIHAGTFNGYPLGLAAIKATLNILKRNNEAVYDHMNRYARLVENVLVEAGKEVGLPILVQGSGGVLLYHCSEEPITGRNLLGLNTYIMDKTLNEAFVKHGILISPVSRMFINVMFNDSDLEFFKDRVGFAVRDAKKVIDDVLGVK